VQKSPNFFSFQSTITFNRFEQERERQPFSFFFSLSALLFSLLFLSHPMYGGGDGASYYGGGQPQPYGAGLQHDGVDDEGAALVRQLAIALGDAEASASQLSSTPASDEPAARRLTAAVQASLTAARASMRDLELFAEEQDT
jgi:hypothetical protein